MANRTPLIAGNWKLNKNLAEAEALARGVADGVAGIDTVDLSVEVLGQREKGCEV